MHTILMPTDCSEYSLAGAEYTAALAEYYGSRVYLLTVVDKGVEKAAKILKTLAARFFPKNDNVLPTVKKGDPAKEIVKFARSTHADIIIMATHGRTGIAHVLMGSVAEKVVRLSPVPVLTVKPAGLRIVAMEQEDIEEQLHLKS